MAWMLWLLAPVAMTGSGAAVLWLRARSEDRAARWAGRDTISAHHALLAALAHGHPNEALPVTFVLLPTPAEEVPAIGG